MNEPNMDDNGMDYSSPQVEMFYTPPDSRYLLTTVEDVREFCLAGKAIISLYSHKTTRHYTYKIKRTGGDRGIWWVSRLGIERSWIFLGGIFDESIRFGSTKQTTVDDRRSIQFEVFNWFWDELQHRNKIHKKLSVYHEGKCGMCGSPLTDPESIKQGYGPECRKKRFARPAVI